jgi:hypothetical protein
LNDLYITLIGLGILGLLVLILYCVLKHKRKSLVDITKEEFPQSKESIIDYFDRLFPSLLFSNVNAEDKQTTCKVCFENFNAEDIVKLTACKHLFHSNCIIQNIICGQYSKGIIL